MKRLVVLLFLVVSGISYAFDTSVLELSLSTATSNYKGKVYYETSTEDPLLNFFNSKYWIESDDSNLTNKWNTFSRLDFEYGRDWGIYFNYYIQNFKDDSIQSEDSPMAGFFKSEGYGSTPYLLISSFSYGLQKRVVDKSNVNIYVGLGYKGVQVGLHEDFEGFIVLGDDDVLDTVNAIVKAKFKLSDMFMFNLTGNYGYGTNAGSVSGLDANLTYGKRVFGKIGVNFESFDTERGETVLDGDLTMYYAGIGIRY